MEENSKKVLIIEDEKTLSQALATKMQTAGLQVICAFDGVEGLEKALAEKPDLILLDIVLPKLDGLSVLEQLKSNEWGKSVPVIILTNLSQVDAEEQSKEKGAAAFLVKTNWKLDEVLEKVQAILGSN